MERLLTKRTQSTSTKAKRRLQKPSDLCYLIGRACVLYVSLSLNFCFKGKGVMDQIGERTHVEEGERIFMPKEVIIDCGVPIKEEVEDETESSVLIDCDVLIKEEMEEETGSTDDIKIEERLDNTIVRNKLLLPKTSKVRYEEKYHNFKEWCGMNSINKISENVLLAYFTNKAKHIKYSTLWSLYSMLKSTILINDNINISNYNKLKTFIKRQGANYEPKKANVFLREEINKFMNEAPDDKYLMFKVVLIIGLAGGCRCEELTNMKLEDVQENENNLIVDIPSAKNNKQRTFIVSKQISSINAIELFRKYKSLRPVNTPHNRLFICYKNKKCTVQPVGINTISKIPAQIASYLKLKNSKQYTGHSFRLTSASLLVNEGSDLLRFKQHGGWKSSAIAEGYVETSMYTKTNTANVILQGQGPQEVQFNSNNIPPSTSSNLFNFSNNNTSNNKPNIINYGNNCTINITINN